MVARWGYEAWQNRVVAQRSNLAREALMFSANCIGCRFAKDALHNEIQGANADDQDTSETDIPGTQLSVVKRVKPRGLKCHTQAL
jgi:hypothetical protein